MHSYQFVFNRVRIIAQVWNITWCCLEQWWHTWLSVCVSLIMLDLLHRCLEHNHVHILNNCGIPSLFSDLSLIMLEVLVV